MPRLACLTLATVLILTGLTAAAVADTVADAFPLGAYLPWERVSGMAERNGMEKWEFVEWFLDDLKAHNMDAVWAVNLNIKELPGLAQRVADRQMKLVPALAELHYNIAWRRNNWEYLETKSRAAIAAAGDSPAIIAWALCDEPRKHFVEEMELFRRKFAQWGAKQPGIVVTMWHDTPAYAENADFPIVCPDIYPYFSDGNPNGPNTPGAGRSWYRRHAVNAARLAYANGQTPWIMPQSFSDVWGPWKYDEDGNVVMLPGSVLHWRAPTVGEMRWQVWSALAAGVQGFFWFCSPATPVDRPNAKPYEGKTFPERMIKTEETNLGWPGALVGPNRESTPQYEAAAEAFGEVMKLRPALTGAVPAKLPMLEMDAPGWAGTLYNPKSQRTFCVVVNDDTDHEQKIKGWVVRAHDLRDLRTGEVIKRGADNIVTITLGPGEGTVVEAAE